MGRKASGPAKDCKVFEVVGDIKPMPLWHGFFLVLMMIGTNLKKKSKAQHDLVIIAVLVIAAVAVSIGLDFHERLVDLVDDYEAFELDEILLIGAYASSFCFVWFAWRRLEESRMAEELLLENEARYRSLIESTDDSIYLVNVHYNYIYVNKKHTSRLGIKEGQINGQPFSRYHTPEETKSFREKIDKVFRTGMSDKYEYQSNRDEKHFLQTFSPVRGISGKIAAVTVISKDVTLLKAKEEKLYKLSLTDELTGLYNRRGFFALAEQQLKQSMRERKGRVLISADLDYLKEINDNLGHDEGDSAIISAADVMKKSFRSSDIIARLGGDEFVILAVEMPESTIESTTSRLKANIDKFNTGSDRKYELSISMGVTLYDPEKPCSVDKLLSDADKLMYEDKRRRKSG